MQALGIVCYVGISFGPVFTASIGGTRREFMLVGDVVNTAGEELAQPEAGGAGGPVLLRGYLNPESCAKVIQTLLNQAALIVSRRSCS